MALLVYLAFSLSLEGLVTCCLSLMISASGGRCGSRTRERGLVFKAHRLVYHSTLGLSVIKKKKKKKVTVGISAVQGAVQGV